MEKVIILLTFPCQILRLNLISANRLSLFLFLLIFRYVFLHVLNPEHLLLVKLWIVTIKH